MRRSTSPSRRRVLRAGGAAAPWPLTATKGGRFAVDGGFTDIAWERGHGLPAAGGRTAPGPAAERVSPVAAAERVSVLIVGAGIAGLAAARALKAAGIDDYRIVELDDAIGGNSRSASVGGLPCPAGAHYLPLPGAAATEVHELLTELGVRDAAGNYDERMRVHSPQERLFIHGVWQEGLLPRVAQPASAGAAHRRFAERVEAFRERGGFAIPVARARPDPRAAALAAVSFRRWLDDERIDDPGLRWFLDYCCRDDYGAGIGRVSAWAGLHYFASRHGFAADDEAAGRGDETAGQGTLTWPEGNGWLSRRLAAPHRDRIRTGVMVTRIGKRPLGDRTVLEVDATRFDRGSARAVPVAIRADEVIWAAPAFVAARVLDATDPDFAAIRDAAARLRYAPWVVANLLFDDERVGDWPDLRLEPPAWDNVLYGSRALGYVDARHQRLDRKGGPRLWTWYASLGDAADGRARLLGTPWKDWVETIVADLRPAHPDLASHLRRVDVHRWGHAMVVPEPGLAGSEVLARLREPAGRFRIAHADLAGYSIFEEALYWGTRAGGAAARQLGRG